MKKITLILLILIAIMLVAQEKMIHYRGIIILKLRTFFEEVKAINEKTPVF